MAKASVGPNPLHDMAAFKKWQRARKATPEAFHAYYKRSNFVERKLQHTDGAGWTHLPKRPEMRKLTDPLTGNLYDMPVNDYSDFLSFIRTDSELSEEYKKSGRLKDTATPADYIDYVFNKTKRGKLVQEGCGHISLLEYDPYYQLLRVTFTNNGTVVVFFRVPNTVANTLIALAQSKATGIGRDGSRRHQLGIYFWDLIRIRGTKYGARYAFEYSEGGPTGEPGGRKQGGYYEVDTGPSPRDLSRVVSDLRAKDKAGIIGGTDLLRQMYDAQKRVRKALKDGNFEEAQSILENLKLEQYTDASRFTRATYVPSGQMDSIDLEDKRDIVAENLADFETGRQLLLGKDVDDYGRSNITDILNIYLDASGGDAEKALQQAKGVIADFDARAKRLNTSHRRTFNNLGRPRMDDETQDNMIGIDVGGRSISALLRQEQYLIRLGLWP